MKSISLLTSASTLAAIALFASSVSADIVITVAETPTGVSVDGVGTLDLEGLSIIFEGEQAVGINPGFPVVVAGGPAMFSQIDSYGLSAGAIPPNIGPGNSFSFATTFSGDNFGFQNFLGTEELFVPDGYVSGSPLSGSSFHQGESLASIGLTSGSYGFTIPSGDSVTLNISAIPEPTSAVLLCCGLCGSVFVFRRR